MSSVALQSFDEQSFSHYKVSFHTYRAVQQVVRPGSVELYIEIRACHTVHDMVPTANMTERLSPLHASITCTFYTILTVKQNKTINIGIAPIPKKKCHFLRNHIVFGEELAVMSEAKIGQVRDFITKLFCTFIHQISALKSGGEGTPYCTLSVTEVPGVFLSNLQGGGGI